MPVVKKEIESLLKTLPDQTLTGTVGLFAEQNGIPKIGQAANELRELGAKIETDGKTMPYTHFSLSLSSLLEEKPDRPSEGIYVRGGKGKKEGKHFPQDSKADFFGDHEHD